MQIFNHKHTINGRIAGTGWLPPFPDLRDYSEQNEKIIAITGNRLRDKKGREAEGLRGGEAKRIVDLREWCSEVEDQESIGSCTAHAAASIVEYYERRAYGKHLEASRLFLYKTTRNLMQVTGDKGAFIRCTMGALVLCGLPDEKYWPYDESKFDKEPSAFVYALANNYKTVKYFRHDVKGREAERQRDGKAYTQDNYPLSRSASQPFSLIFSPTTSSAAVLDSVKKYLEAGIPSMFGFYGFDSFDKSDIPGGIPFPAQNEAARWGHAVAAVGFDDDKKVTNLVNSMTTKGALLIRNSWGKSWGEHGYGWLPYDYVRNGLAEDFWSLVRMEWIDAMKFVE